MTRMIFALGTVVSLVLMSFVENKNEEIIMVRGKSIFVKNTEKISKEDLKFLRENVLGWQRCDYQSTSNECTTKHEFFPDDPKKDSEIEEIIKKYQ